MVRRSPKKHNNQERTYLLVSKEEAMKRVSQQIERANTIPNRSINENEEARRWYDYTEDLLRQIFSTNELADEFTGRSSLCIGNEDITTGRYLNKLRSIYERLELYSEDDSVPHKCISNDPVVVIKMLIDKFHAVTRQLRHRYDDRPTLDVVDEYDVHDLFHALLRIHFDDIRPEEWTPSYAGGSSRMDFLLKSEKIVIEIKKTRAKLGSKEVRDQLAIDIQNYRVHTDCKTLVCFVYDPEERIQNPKGLEQDLSQPLAEMQVKTYITQR